MATDVEKLLVRLEVTQTRFERQLAAANAAANKRAQAIEKSFVDANRRIEGSFQRVGASAQGAFAHIGRLAALAAAGIGAQQVMQYADAWTEAQNKIAAAEQVAGQSARTLSEINDIATSTRSGLSDTVSLYTRLMQVSGQLGVSEKDVARATEIVAKAFKAGGAAAQEQAAGVLQLGQALGSGVLQGDELRSLRENAPLLAQAIADEFGVTIGQLKILGEQGALTADRVFQAILKAQAGIDQAFAATKPTIQDGLTVLFNGLTEAAGAFSAGSGAADTFAGSLMQAGAQMGSMAESAARLGGQIGEAFAIMGEAIAAVRESLDFSDRFAMTAEQTVALADVARNAFLTMQSEAAGVGSAIAQTMLNFVQDVANAGVGMANAAISAIETLLNGAISGINAMAEQINGLIEAANSIPGVSIGALGQIGPVSIGRVSAPEVGAGSVADAYAGARDAVRQGIEDAFARTDAAGERAARRWAAQFDPMQGPNLPAAAGGSAGGAGAGAASGGSGGGGSKGGSRAKAAAEDMKNVRVETERLGEAARAVDSAMESAFSGMLTGIKDADDAAKGLFDTLARIVTSAFYQQVISPGANQLVGSIANTIGSTFGIGAAGRLNATLGQNPQFMSLFKSFDGGGYTGAGARMGGVDGKGGFPAILHPNETVIDHTKGAAAGGASRVVIELGEGLEGRILGQALQQSVQITRAASSAQSRAFGRAADSYRDRGTS